MAPNTTLGNRKYTYKTKQVVKDKVMMYLHLFIVVCMMLALMLIPFAEKPVSTFSIVSLVIMLVANFLMFMGQFEEKKKRVYPSVPSDADYVDPNDNDFDKLMKRQSSKG